MSERAFLANGIEGRHVLISLLLFFGVMLLANGIFLYYALATFAGGDTSDPYRQGQHYNETIADATRQEKQGWGTILTYQRGPQRLSLSVSDKAGRQVSGLHLDAALGRPATDKDDFTVKLTEVSQGVYAADARLAPGQWLVSVTAHDPAGGSLYRLKQRLWVGEEP
jgi:nitrogen fixation protein FixH